MCRPFLEGDALSLSTTPFFPARLSGEANPQPRFGSLLLPSSSPQIILGRVMVLLRDSWPLLQLYCREFPVSAPSLKEAVC